MWAAHVLAARFLQLEGDGRRHIDWLQPSPSCTGARNMLSASLTCPAATADRAVGHMCRCAEASAHHLLAHGDARHVAAVADTPDHMIVQWLELNRACAQPPAPHARTPALKGSGLTCGAGGMWAAHVPAARFLQLEGNVKDVPDSLQPLPSCMEAADVLSASPICLAATADRGVPHMCRIAEHTITGSTTPPLVWLE